MTAATNAPTVLQADQEHGGLRMAVLGAFALGAVGSFFLLLSILQSGPDGLLKEFAVAVSCLMGLVLGVAASGISEAILKRKWTSGKSVTFDGSRMTVKRGQQAEAMDMTKRVVAVRWQFKMSGFPRGGRERRVPRNWHCLGCQLQQDDRRLVVFSFMPEPKANMLGEKVEFFEIAPGDYYQSNLLRKFVAPPDRPEIPTKVLAGKNGAYWLAEKRRWTEGLELTADDFVLFVDLTASLVD